MSRGTAPGAAAPASARRQPPLRIGLSARILHDSPAEMGFRGKTLQYLERSIAHWIMARGALAFMVPTLDKDGPITRAGISVSDYARELDGLVLQGGADVSPESYGEAPLRPEWAGDRVRDLYEIDLLWEFVIQGKPVLGVCRGEQLINVAFGGSLVQDIATQLPGAGAHVDLAAYDAHRHEVVFEPGSSLARMYASRGGGVVSIHHQCVGRLGNGLAVEARAAGDGVIEALRGTGVNYVMGVQWHPEFHQGTGLLDPAPLLDGFLAAARAARAATA